ncbi:MULTISPECIES: TorD/DmsD family molecular chaperone [Dickeya]|uniref:YcdX chaperone redox enzyme maturation protein (REMP) n=1 Tax=Dickeya aquatica TaxID=1401087 RepID=A0A375AB00_9GAMM|nr:MULTISPECIES: molecular chaperone [Dickeya]SLM63220.1 YcdX chaperone; redox enzyme maturation protein (REMP) [Dickeya aquatica]
MNEFSMVCRILGTLFNRPPQDPLLEPLLNLISQGKLAQQWPLAQDELMARWQRSVDVPALQADYDALFGAAPAVPPRRGDWLEEAPETEVRTFLQQRGMPLGEGPADKFGSLLLAASWLEDQAQEDETAAQSALFDDYVLTWSDRFLGKLESHATTPFYRTLAIICREALEAMRDELAEADADEGNDDAESA